MGKSKEINLKKIFLNYLKRQEEETFKKQSSLSGIAAEENAYEISLYNSLKTNVGMIINNDFFKTKKLILGLITGEIKFYTCILSGDMKGIIHSVLYETFPHMMTYHEEAQETYKRIIYIYKYIEIKQKFNLIAKSLEEKIRNDC